ncbi:hypothetical protein GCM10009443_33390 [Mucilaginibacter ginsenosidivorans]
MMYNLFLRGFCQIMDIEKLKISMRKDIENRLPKQAVFNNHFKYLNDLVVQGYKLPVLNEMLGLGIKTSYFQSLYKIAKVKKGAVTKTLSVASPEETPRVKTVGSEWAMIFHDISSNLINDIGEAGFDIEDVRAWVSDNSLISSAQLRKHLQRLIDTP